MNKKIIISTVFALSLLASTADTSTAAFWGRLGGFARTAWRASGSKVGAFASSAALTKWNKVVAIPGVVRALPAKAAEAVTALPSRAKASVLTKWSNFVTLPARAKASVMALPTTIKALPTRAKDAVVENQFKVAGLLGSAAGVSAFATAAGHLSMYPSLTVGLAAMLAPLGVPTFLRARGAWLARRARKAACAEALELGKDAASIAAGSEEVQDAIAKADEAAEAAVAAEVTENLPARFFADDCDNRA